MQRHTILFLAANPSGTSPVALDREARAIHRELEASGHRDRFELETRWAAEPLDLLRELRKLKPSVVHFSGHGGYGGDAGGRGSGGVSREIGAGPARAPVGPPPSLFFQRPDGSAHPVSSEALAQTFGAAGASVRVVVLNACYSAGQAQDLLAHIDCVVGMSTAVLDTVARAFAVGFYGGLGEAEPVAAAFRQGCAAVSLLGLPQHDVPRLETRPGIDASRLVL